MGFRIMQTGHSRRTQGRTDRVKKRSSMKILSSFKFNFLLFRLLSSPFRELKRPVLDKLKGTTVPNMKLLAPKFPPFPRDFSLVENKMIKHSIPKGAIIKRYNPRGKGISKFQTGTKTAHTAGSA